LRWGTIAGVGADQHVHVLGSAWMRREMQLHGLPREADAVERKAPLRFLKTPA
jgi:hypothetical protein